MIQENPFKLIRQPEVLHRTGYSKTALQTRIKEGLFPRAISIGDRSIAWVESEVAQAIVLLISEKPKKELKKLVHEIHKSRNEGVKCS